MRGWKEPDDSCGESVGNLLADYLSPRNVFFDFLYTVIISTLIAVFLTLTGLSDSFLPALVVSQSFGLSICSIIMGSFWLFKPKKATSITIIAIAGVAGGTLLGLQMGHFLLQRFFSMALTHPARSLLQSILLAVTFGGIVSYFFFSKARLKFNKGEIQQERILRLSKEKEALEANLKLLQAQIEPHFLFNTLSNVLSLIDTNPAKGKSMLMDLIHYLRTSLSRTRHDLITLDQEVELIRAYLNILKIRMGERLRFRIEVPEDLKGQPFPPMLLQPLVENAVKHGLDPKIEGGEILIKVAENEGFIRCEVMDSGIGFTSYSEAGIGMGNVGERLRLLYGEKGRLFIEENEPSGVKAVIEVPKGGGDRP